MLVVINALKSIIRSKGRVILIGIIVLTIAASSSIALAIRSAADAAAESGLAAQTITGTISLDRQMLMESTQGDSGSFDKQGMREIMQQYSNLSLSEMQDYAESDYVEDFYYTGSTSLNAGEGIEAFSTDDTSSMQNFAGNGMNGGFGGNVMGDFTIAGYSSEYAMTSFISGESKIIDGTMFDTAISDNNCLISSELALFNDLTVGSTISLANANNEEDKYTFTVAGIYTNASSSTESGQMMFGTANDPANMIIISYQTLNTLEEQSLLAATTIIDENNRETTTAISLQTSGTYVFANQENYESFGEEIRSKGLSDYYALSSSDINSYEQSLVPLENLSSFALTLLIIILVVGAIILMVLNIFNIRERKYEVGVLTAIGIKKAKVAAQFVLELLVVTLVAIVIGTGIGAAASVPVSNNLLESQIQVEESVQSTQEQNFGRQGGNGFNMGNSETSVEYIDTINAGVNFNILLELMGIGVLLTIFSSLAAIIFVLRYDPLKILTNRA